MIVDCHCHAGKGDGLTGPWDTEAPLGAYLRRARAAGIDKTVIFPAFGGDYARANAALARIAARHPGRLLCFALVHPMRDAGRIREMVDRAVTEWGFLGIKVHRGEAPATREVCEAARAYQIPVLYDVANHVYRAEVIAGQYPDVKFIIPHLGSYDDDWRVHLHLIDLMTRMPNVYADTSNVNRFDDIVAVVRRAGAGRVLFGSDGPWSHPGVELEKIRLLRLAPHDEALVLGGNLLRLIRDARVPARVARTRVMDRVAGRSTTARLIGAGRTRSGRDVRGQMPTGTIRRAGA